MANTLTPQELEDLTGSPQPKKQMDVLSRDGKIRTTWAAVNSVLVQKAKNDEQEPDLDFLRHG